MISCKFQVPAELLTSIDELEEEAQFDNISVFENIEFGFSDKLDEHWFPIANVFDVEILVNTEENAKNLWHFLSERFGEKIRSFRYATLKNEDWVQAYLSELKPVTCDNFYFYNEHVQSAPDLIKPENIHLIPIKLNSALAFGSGHHQTTRACLLNMRHLFERNDYELKSILDMGCGTGILGICALKVWKKAKLIGIDIDAEAVKITADNYEANGIKATAFKDTRPPNVTNEFDLIFCNILKQPLVDLCPEFARVMKQGAYIITSGFITAQEVEIGEIYATHGFENVNRIQIDDWISIMFRKK